MGIKLDITTEAVMDLETYLDLVRREVRPGDHESLLSTAPALRALSNDRRFLADRILAELVGQAGFQVSNEYTAQTLLLGSGPGFLLRANVWTPEDPQARTGEGLFFYAVPHDHSFDFLTVGHHGPGYETDLYEYERASIDGLPGEPVDLVPRGRARLGPGEVMFYRAFRDVHTQRPPEAFSISLNLLCVDPAELREQLFFDVERGRVVGAVPGGAERRALLCDIAAHLGDARTSSLLEQVAAEHPCGRTRAAARGALARLEPSEEERLWACAHGDPHPYVRAMARARLSALEGADR